MHLLLCCPKIGICAHHIYKLKVVSKRMNIVLHSIIGYTIIVSIANFDCFAAIECLKEQSILAKFLDDLREIHGTSVGFDCTFLPL